MEVAKRHEKRYLTLVAVTKKANESNLVRAGLVSMARDHLHPNR